MDFPHFDSNDADLRAFMELQFFDASNISALTLTPLAGASILPLINRDEKTIKDATFQKHYKFCIRESLTGTDKGKIYKCCMLVLKVFGDLLPDMFSGRICEEKLGLLSFANEYDTTLRIWTTKKVGKNLFYEVTVCGYKDAIAREFNCDKKVVIRASE
jgi:hypothetical protein